ncbi:Pentatricopeptide repeat-containing protein [Quillaja saponaria]|uniref:Pentatricopeptide repeat-containing protein n=1 Tax=Quillaja saponaria TaxID=32244 RepID=A0AAD7KTB1_QUISA|nr:Pentatricopeptide repeat-containing protein [Quillaja saponaria]
MKSKLKNLVKFNRLLAELTHSNRCRDSLKLFSEIHSSHSLRPDHYTLSTILTACANLRNITFGNQLHAHAIQTGLKVYSHVANTLLSLYAKAEDLNSVRWVFGEIEYPDVYSWTTLLSACTRLGNIDYAYELFDEMPRSDVEIWNAIITGCAENGNEQVAINLFRQMHLVGVRHDNYTFASILSLCSLELLDYGRHVHSAVIKTGFLVRTSVVNSLITMYFNCKNVADACEVFKQTEAAVRDHITFNVMIDGLVSMERNEEAFMMFREMQGACVIPTELTFVSVLSSCSSVRVGCQIHAQAIKASFIAYTSVSNATMTMYAGCRDLLASQTIFERLQEKDLISWNIMISSYAQENLGHSAILTYLQMRRAGIEPDQFTYGSLIAASGYSEFVELIHSLVSKSGLMTIEVCNSLVSTYSRHGKIKQAYQIFHDISYKNLISWNCIISGFLISGCPEQSLELFCEFLKTELNPNVYTLSLILSICASITALRHGKQVHGYIFRHGFSLEISLSNALITMYAKCGILDRSLEVFNMMFDRDTVSWNALISAYARHGQGKEAVCCFETMQDSPLVKPDEATFTAVLSACSHAGRSGYLDEAERMINSEHFKGHPNMWWSLFSACAAHGNLRLGRTVARLLLETENNIPSVYVLLSNIYAAAGHWQEAADLRDIMRNNRTMKQPGCSWIRF